MLTTRRVLLTLVTLLLSACASLPVTPAPVVSPALQPASTSTPFSLREATLLLPEFPDNLNPLYARSWSARAVQGLFLSGLWQLDERLSPVPELALEIPSRANGGISPDGQTLTIRLRPDALWSDGYPLTALDVVFTYEMARAMGNDVPSRFPYDAFVEAVVALDTHTVQVRFSRPFAPWPAVLFPFILPRHILEPVFAREGTLDRAVWNRTPTVGSGPFVCLGQVGEDLAFEANSRYWRGRPALDRVRVRVVADPAMGWAAVAAGTADLAPFLWPQVPPEEVAPPGVRLLASPSGYVETLFFNQDPRTGHPVLQDSRARAALAQAVDREEVCRAMGWQAVPAATLLSGMGFENPALQVPPASMAEAARRLDEAGWRDADGDGLRERDGVTMTLRYAIGTGVPGRITAISTVAGMLTPVGAHIEPVPPGAAEPWADSAGWDLGQWAAQPVGYPDPDDPRWLCVEARPGGHNPAGVCDGELDRLLALQATTTDPDERLVILFQIQDMARQEAWWVPLCRWEDLWAVSDRLRGPRPWRGAPFWNAWEWSVAW